MKGMEWSGATALQMHLLQTGVITLTISVQSPITVIPWEQGSLLLQGPNDAHDGISATVQKLQQNLAVHTKQEFQEIRQQVGLFQSVQS